jgi:hypothetical protein
LRDKIKVEALTTQRLCAMDFDGELVGRDLAGRCTP